MRQETTTTQKASRYLEEFVLAGEGGFMIRTHSCQPRNPLSGWIQHHGCRLSLFAFAGCVSNMCLVNQVHQMGWETLVRLRGLTLYGDYPQRLIYPSFGQAFDGSTMPIRSFDGESATRKWILIRGPPPHTRSHLTCLGAGGVVNGSTCILCMVVGSARSRYADQIP